MHPLNHNDRVLWLFVFLSFLFTFITFAFNEFQIFQLKNNSTPVSPTIVYATISPTSSPFITPTPSSTPTSSPKAVSSQSSQTSKSITYIPLTGGSTQNTDWTSIDSTSFTLKFSDYGSKASAVWDANLQAANPGDVTYARLFDTTHGIAVNGSEINLSTVSNSTDVTSGSLSFWQGNNNYVIQLKSLTGSPALTYSGRIKITY